MEEDVKNMRSESASSIYFHIKLSGQSDDYIIPKVHIDNITYLNSPCQTNGFK